MQLINFNNMKAFKFIFIIILCIVSTTAMDAQKYKYKSSRNNEVVMLGVGANGTKVFKIYSTARRVEDAIALAKKEAVEICLFVGLPAGANVQKTPPICKASAEQENAEFFEDFFTPGGKYLRYINMTSDGVPSGQDRLKIKRGYMVGLKVQILYDNLKRDLEEQGIVKGLSHGF